ncbi:unnamed protein product, partial [Mesorhabditis belari]|uniref:SSD domain-containing protein n=1 Tax=Mesorhabditis belari TaxID=2138241 RepID=A0AAF3FK25_9BILA
MGKTRRILFIVQWPIVLYLTTIFSFIIRVSGNCVLTDTCHTVRHGTEWLAIPCFHRTPITPTQIDEKSQRKLANLCPHLFSANHSTNVCCSPTQIDVLISQMSMATQILKRCDSCVDNFLKLWCDFTCHPDQHNFMQVTKANTSAETKKEYVDTVTYNLSTTFGNGLFDSCKNVQFMQSRALDLMCGGGGGECTLKKWLGFMGTQDHSNRIPFNINFNVIENSTNLPTTRTTPCNKRVRAGKTSCSCSDCELSCPTQPIAFDWMTSKPIQKCFERLPLECYPLGVAMLGAAMLILLIAFVSCKSWIFTDGNCEDCKADAAQCFIFDLGEMFEDFLQRYAMSYGSYAVRKPWRILTYGFVVALLLTVPVYKLSFSEELVDMWSAPHSRARIEKEFFDKHFSPFMRTEQVTIYPQKFPHDVKAGDSFNSANGETFGPVFRRPFLDYAFKLIKGIYEIQVETCLDDRKLNLEDLSDCKKKHNVTLDEICLKPMGAQSPCLVISPTSYFQNDPTKLNLEKKVEAPTEASKVDDWDYYVDESEKKATPTIYTYLDHLQDCIRNPMNLRTRLGLSCLGDYGGTIQPQFVFGNDDKSLNSSFAVGIMMTFPISNAPGVQRKAMAWEKAFIAFMKNSHHHSYTISFMSERSIQDEIEAETKSDAILILIAYVLMIAYASFSLGQYHVTDNNLRSIMIQSRVLVSLLGVLIAALSVCSSMGMFGMLGIKPTLLLLLIVPFVVLVIAFNNIFLIIRAYQRSRLLQETLEDRVSAFCGQLIPSILSSTASTVACFALGSMSDVPTVSIFSMCCALALVFNFYFQMTFFLVLFIWDIKRSEQGRPEFSYWERLHPDRMAAKGYMFLLFRKAYARTLLSAYVRPVVLIVFTFWIITSVYLTQFLDVGMDQRIPLPEGSYVIRQFNSMDRFHTVGPPVYFVVKGEIDYTNPKIQQAFCTTGGCDENSIGNILRAASNYPQSTMIAKTGMLNWMDDFLDWQDPVGEPPCCRRKPETGRFCSAASTNSSDCVACETTPFGFYERLGYFTKDIPGDKCPKGGAAAHGGSIFLSGKRVDASHFMAFHTRLANSSDFVKAVAAARKMAGILEEKLREVTRNSQVEIFPYSVFYVFYDVYPNIVSDAATRICTSIAAIMLVSYITLGFDFITAISVLLAIVASTVNMLGAMSLFEIEFNPLSLANIFMSLAISVEFCAHIARAYKQSQQESRHDRISDALVYTGSSIVSGLFLCMFGGTIVLAFAHAQIFKIYFFRMFSTMMVLGFLHGLVLLPVILSYIGPIRVQKPQQETSEKKIRWSLPILNRVSEPFLDSSLKEEARVKTPTKLSKKEQEQLLSLTKPIVDDSNLHIENSVRNQTV